MAPKADASKRATKAKASPPKHAPFLDMIKDAILNLKERNGSSRQAIKKYIQANNNLSNLTDQQFNNHVSRALSTGEENGVFERPKGPSGPVKLKKPSAEKKTETKATVKPAVTKKTTTTKKTTATKKAPATKKATTTKKTTAAKPKANASKPRAKKAAAGPAPAVGEEKSVVLGKTKSGRVTKSKAPQAAKPAAKKAAPKKTATKKRATPKKA